MPSAVLPAATTDTRVGYLYDAFAEEVVDQYKAEAAGGSKSSAKK